MGALLTGAPIAVRDEADVSLVRQAVREAAGSAGLATERAESLVAAASEIAHNQIRHARWGEISVQSLSREGVAGVEVHARDAGPGIADPTAALRGPPAANRGTGGGLGVGLGAAYRLADEIDFDVRLGEGTTMTARKFAHPIPRSEVAILGRPHPDEKISGDDACFARRAGALLLLVADGLGHGPLARAAAARAIGLVRASDSVAPVELLTACQPALVGTRGAVLAAATIAGADLSHAGVGNIACHLYQGRAGSRLPSHPGVVGQPGAHPRLQVQKVALGPRYVLVMYTDGLSSRLDLTEDAALLREPPLVIAHQLMTRHARNDDDALVLVTKG